MTRFGRYGQKESPWAQDGDPYFNRIDMLHDRGMLAAGTLARCENKRLRDGVAATRPGTTFPGDFNPAFANKIIGSGIYSNPNGDEVMLVATASANYVWALQFNKDPVQIQIDPTDPTQSTGTFFVHFVQAFDKVLLLRYPFNSQPPLVWDGVNGNKFVPVATGGPHTLIPLTIMGVPFKNRVLYYDPYFAAVPERDQFLMSDILDYAQYDIVNGVFRINAGESDLITSIIPYFKGAVIVFMRDSIHMVQDFTIDTNETRQRLINSEIGSVGIYGPVMVGGDILFLSRPNGFYRLAQVDVQDQIIAPPVPISRGIQPVIDRINWDRANIWTCSAQLGDYVYFAVPTGEGISFEGSNIIVVLNAATGEWESAPDWWDDADFRINRLHVTLYDTAKRVFAIDYVASRIYLLYDGLEDEINGDSKPVRDVIETRGYTCVDPAGFKRFERAIIGLRSYDPDGKVTAIADGVNEEKEIASLTKNRLRYYTHGTPDFDPIADDPTAPKREDYSTPPTDVAIEDFENLPEGDLIALPPTSLVFTGTKQQSLERFQVRQNGRWCSLRIENNNGQLDVLGTAVEGIPAQEGTKVVA